MTSNEWIQSLIIKNIGIHIYDIYSEYTNYIFFFIQCTLFR